MTKGKWVVLLLCLVFLLSVVSGCDGNGEDDAVTENGRTEEVDRVFTMEEVSQYDGQDGREAYVVIDGYVYDVTDVPQWSGGTHAGLEAGTDATDALMDESPHGDRVLDDLDIVGKLETAD